MKIIKRSGEEVDFDVTKILTAVAKANNEVAESEKLSEEQIGDIGQAIWIITNSMNHTPNVEEIQDLVENQIMTKKKFEVARKYITYRYKKALVRKSNTTDEQILSLIECNNEEVKQENSNKNPTVVSVQRDYMAGEVSKDIAKRFLLPSDIWEAHKQGIIHFHDADYFAQHMSNCCLVNLEDMLQNGTVISETMIEKPHSFSTACNIATQVIAQIASSQYGGQSITLSHLAPFVDVSRQKYIKLVREENEAIGRHLSEEEILKLAEIRTKDEIKRGVQTIQYQVITLMTTNGQAPFITVFMYLNEVQDKQTKDDLALIIEEVLKQRMLGVKNEKGVYITPAFPKLIYVLEEDNISKDAKYWYLTELAAKCTAKRMVPDYISEKIMKEVKENDCYPSMGCVDGKERVLYHYKNRVFYESFESMWYRLSKTFEIKKQPNGIDDYMDTPGILIYDSKEGFVDNFRVIRNTSKDWLNIGFSNGRKLLCTIDHPFETENRGVVLAKDLTYNDVIATDIKTPNEITIIDYMDRKEKNIQLCSIESMDKIQHKAYSYDVTTASEHFTVSGIYSHNCRSFLTVDRFADTVGNIAHAKNFDKYTHHYYGRFNQGVVTINLVDVACSSDGDFEKFWRILDERLELCHRALRCRHERLLNTPSDVAPILWQNGALARLERGETINKLLYDGYSTISLGYAGIAEMTYRMYGCYHIDSDDAKNFALSVMQKLNDKCNEWKAAENIDYSVYGTPLESTTYKFAKCLQKRFGIIKNVTDHNYITNSYHVCVREEIDAFSKLSKEAEFQRLSPGGAISYVEVPDMKNNIPAVLALLKHIYYNIMYGELNTKSDYCQVCGLSGQIQIVNDDDGKLVWECPNCGNRDQKTMNVARRTCGYIGTQYWNQGRTQEIKERILNL